MNYLQLTIQATEQEQEYFISILLDYGATGFEQQENKLIAYFIEPDVDTTAIEKLLCGYTYTWQIVGEQNWNAVWESNFRPVTIDDFCGIRAHFHQPLLEVQHEIIITPKMSFGTGHHATTYMMIEQMKKMNFVNKAVFDFGTGTGILSILAEKLGAQSIVATDIDMWSITNAHENILANNCKRIQIIPSSEVPLQQTFDIIVANINKNIIQEHLPQMVQALHKTGSILVSGLLAKDEKGIIDACKNLGLNISNKLQRQHWISLLFIT